MVFSLKSLKHIEDKKLISGHICKFLGQFDEAQVCKFSFTSVLYNLFLHVIYR